MRTAHSKNLKIGENIGYGMLKRSIKTIFGFFEILTRNKKFEFFCQIKELILQSVNGEEKLTNELQNLVKLYYGKIAKCAQCCKIPKRIIKIGQIREKLKNTFIWPLL